MLPSMHPAASRLSPADKARQRIGADAPLRHESNVLLLTFHNRTVVSTEPLTTNRPSFVTASAVIGPEWPISRETKISRSRSHISITASRPPVNNHVPLGV